MSTAKGKAAGVVEAGATVLSNPVVWYVLIGIGAVIVADTLLPDIFKKAKAGIGGAFDDITSGLGQIVGHNPDQNPDNRTREDQLRGLLSAQDQDRALSDLVDDPWQYIKGLVVGTQK